MKNININKKPVIIKLEIWGDSVLLSMKDWKKIVRYLERLNQYVETLEPKKKTGKRTP